MALQILDTETGELQPAEENTGEAKTYTHFGVCRFCGQSGMIDSEHEDEPQEEVNEAVTLQCTCDKDREYQKWISKVEEARGNLCEIAQGVSEDIMVVAEAGLNAIAMLKISQIQIHFDTRVLKIQAKRSGSILVQLTRTEKSAAEA